MTPAIQPEIDDNDVLGYAMEKLFIGEMFSLMKPPIRLSLKDYAETYRRLTSDVSALQGKFDCMQAPVMLYLLECLDNPEVEVIVGKKSAQIAWTETINSYIQKIIHTDPQNIVVAFPRDAACGAYAKEKFRPLVRNSKELLDLIGDPDKCAFNFYKYPGGFIKFVSAGSPNALKSTAAPILIVEEPDDLKEDVKGQGDALKIFKERQKTFATPKLIFGGTPTEEGFSKVDIAYNQSDQSIFEVPCRFCGKFHVLDFQYLKYDPWPDGRLDLTYGRFNPATAYYECPFCLKAWDDADKKWSILEALNYNNLGWRKQRPEVPIVGLAFNELMSLFPGSRLVKLAEKKLNAELEYQKGKEGPMKSFRNNSEGLSYRPRSTNVTAKLLKEKRLTTYQELVVPVGGIILTAGVDVQHDRFAIIVRAWGRQGNSWLVYWGEIFGNVLDPGAPVWDALTKFLMKPIMYQLSTDELPLEIPISAVSIDSGDGNSTQLVYSYVKTMGRVMKNIYATKGDGSAGTNANEIYNIPTDLEQQGSRTQRKTLYERMGTYVYMVGVQRAKDEVMRKLALTGNRDRMYHYQNVREDYEEQLLSNRKRLSASGNGTRYELIPGHRDEALDCEVLALHASRAINLHLWAEKHWSAAEELITRANEKKLIQDTSEQNVFPGIN